MLIKDMFEKDICRDFDDVIKVDDDTNKQDIFVELDEFIVTEELLNYFNEFFTNFSNGVLNSTKDIGVWISGFFGSGKSHFLKILAYLLDNNVDFDGKKPIDFFIKDKKIHNSEIINKIEISSNFDNNVKLFNVPATSEDKLINIFFKLFNEMQGYCGSLLYVADFEKKLVFKNKYNLFKNKFKETHGKNWEDVRSQFPIFRDEIIQTLNDIEFMSEDSINKFLDTLEINMDISIEKFAVEVNEYCTNHNTNVIFLADEMGQFIAENPTLMSELQAIVEKLSVKCNGKAWIIVTSQHKISTIFDDKIRDFSKIKGRFRTQLNLTSSNVDEVIKLRFLEKNNNAKTVLINDYDKFSSSLKNNILFEDSADMESYSNQEEYFNFYPFIPYQFNLVQESIIAITNEIPDDSSIPYGERSMITCFKNAAVEIRNQENGYLCPYYLFFESIDKFIDPLDLNNINAAKRNKKLDSYDVNVLKVLFLIKFLKNDYLKPTLTNISTLMISDVNEDIKNLRINVAKSLNKLIDQAFVHKNGDVYSYLTKKEQDIDSNIKNQKIEINEIKKDFNEYIRKLYPKKKYKKDKSHSYPISIKIDDIDEMNNDLKINIITPYFEYSEGDLNQSTLTDLNIQDNQLKKLSESNNGIFINLYSYDSIFLEIKEKLQIKKYLDYNNKNISDRRIECEKLKEIEERDDRIEKLINDSIVQSNIYISGKKLEFSVNNAKQIFDKSLDTLFSSVYYNNHFMDNINPVKEDIYQIIKSKSQTTLVDSQTLSTNALNDMENYISKSESKNINDIFSKYRKAPYGFIDIEISWIIANLFSQRRISLVLDDSEILIDDDNADKIAEYILLNNPIVSKRLNLQKRMNIPSQWIKSTKNIYKDLSDEQINCTDEKLMIKFKNILNDKIKEIDIYLYEIERFTRFPGKDKFLKVKMLFNECLTKGTLFGFYKFVFENRTQFNINIEDLNNVFFFFESDQKDIFKEACKISDEHDDNKISLDNDELNIIVDQIYGKISLGEPYSEIHNLKQLNIDYESKFNELLTEKQNFVCNKIDEDLNDLIMLLDSDSLIKHFKADIENDFNNLKYKVNNRRKIHEIMGFADDSLKLKEKYTNEIYQFKSISESTIYIKDILNEEINITNDEELNEVLNKIRAKITSELKVNDIVKIR